MQVLLIAPKQADCFAIRLALTEKGLNYGFFSHEAKNIPKQFSGIQQHNSRAVLIDSQLVVPDEEIMLEFIDERFPAPPLMPLAPVARAQCRIMIKQMYHTWLPQATTLAEHEEQTTKEYFFRELLVLNKLFSGSRYIMGDDISALDFVLQQTIYTIRNCCPGITDPLRHLKRYLLDIQNRETTKTLLARIELERARSSVKQETA